MKIVIVIDSWNKGNGGVVATHRYVNELKARGHEIVLVTTPGKEAENYDGEVHYVDGFYLPGVRESLENMGFIFARGQKRKLRKAYKGADIVHVLFPFFMARNAVNVANKMKIPVMGACHIQSQNITGAMGKDNKVMDWFFNNWFNYQLFNKVKALHCPSEMAADLVKSKGCKSHFRVISNGIPKGFEPKENVQRPEFFEDYFVLMNVGRHAMEKNQEIIIDALLKSKYKDKIKLMLCGKGETSEHLRKRGEELPVEPLIRYISEEEKHQFLNTADLYVHSSMIELESLSCLEAIGYGLPCLIDDVPSSAASQFSLDERFSFKSENQDELTQKIDYWYENRQELAKLRAKVLESAEEYRMDRAITAIEQLYSDVIKAHNGQMELLPKGEKIIPNGIHKNKHQ